MSDPSIEEMLSDLEAADAAGDTELAQHIAGRIKAAQARSAVKPPSGVERAAKTTGETLADVVRGFGSVGGALKGPTAVLGALGSYAVPYTAQPGATFLERYRNELRGQSRMGQEAAQRSPVGYAAGTVASGAVLPIPAPATQAALAARATPAALAASGVYDTALANALLTAYQNVEQPGSEIASRVASAATSPYNLLGAAPAALSQIRPGERLRQSLQAWRERRMTPGAQVLRREGVPTTLGQERPESFLGRLEATSAEHPWGMKGERAAAEEAWRAAQLAKAVKPGEAPLPPGAGSAAQAEAYARFEPQYGAIRKNPLASEAKTALVGDVLKLQKPQGVDAKTWSTATGEIQNALTTLPVKEPNTVGDLLKVRENIRADLRAAVKGQDFDRIRSLDTAQKTLTAHIERSLPAEAVQSLREIDRRYSTLMTIEKAQPAGRTEFTPYQLAKATEAKVGRRTFKHGEGGSLQESAQAAEEAFRPIPFTGGRQALLSTIPGKKYWAGPAASWLNALSAGRPEVPMTPALPMPYSAYMANLLRGRAPRLQLELVPGAAEEGQD